MFLSRDCFDTTVQKSRTMVYYKLMTSLTYCATYFTVHSDTPSHIKISPHSPVLSFFSPLHFNPLSLLSLPHTQALHNTVLMQSSTNQFFSTVQTSRSNTLHITIQHNVLHYVNNNYMVIIQSFDIFLSPAVSTVILCGCVFLAFSLSLYSY